MAQARAAVDAEPARPYPWQALARAEADAGDLAAAVAAQQRYVDLRTADPKGFVFPSDLIQLGDWQAGAGDVDGAAAAYQRASEVRTYDAEAEQVDALMRLGALHRRTGDLSAALDAYIEVARRGDHQWGEAHAEMGRILRDHDVPFDPERWWRSSREEELVAVWRGAQVADDPVTRAEGFAEHGRVLAEQGSVDEAVESLQKAVALGDPTWSPVAQARLDELVAATGRPAPDGPRFTPEELALVDPDAAVAAFAELAGDPDRRRARYGVWQAHGIRMHQGRPSEAVRLAQQAITLDDPDGMTHARFDRLARALAAAGRPAEALVALDQAALEDNLDDEWAAETLRAEQLEALGRQEEAERARERAGELWDGQEPLDEPLLIGQLAVLKVGGLSVWVPDDPEASEQATADARQRQADAVDRVARVLQATGWGPPPEAQPGPAAPPPTGPPPPRNGGLDSRVRRWLGGG